MKEKQRKTPERPFRSGEEPFDIPRESEHNDSRKRRERLEKQRRHEQSRLKRRRKDYEESE